MLPGKRRFRSVFELYITHNIAFGDAYLAVQMQQLKSSQIYRFDRELDRVPDVERLEP